jgi:hypothetical protein
MTPQQKANELVGNFCNVEFLQDYEGMDYELAKECAIIAVNVIIESRKDDGAFDDTKFGNSSEYYTPHPMYLTYWNLVKEEINKL